MKKLLVIGVALVLAGGLYAQGYVGLKGGLNYGSWNPDVADMDAWTGLGYHFGLEAGYMPMPMVAVDIGGFYYIGKWSTTVDDVETDMTINSIYIPLSVKYIFTAAPTVNPFVKAGAGMMMQNSGTVSEDGEETDIDDEDLETDWYVFGGLGVDVSVAQSISVRPDITFQYNLTADDDETEEASESMYDFLFSLGFYYSF